MNNKSLRNTKDLIKRLRQLTISMLALLILGNINAQDVISYQDFDKFYIESLKKYRYPELSIPEFSVLSDVNKISFPKITNDLEMDLLLLIYKIHDITDLNLYIEHEKKSINSDLIVEVEDVANFRLRFIEFLILHKIQSND